MKPRERKPSSKILRPHTYPHLQKVVATFEGLRVVMTRDCHLYHRVKEGRKLTICRCKVYVPVIGSPGVKKELLLGRLNCHKCFEKANGNGNGKRRK